MSEIVLKNVIKRFGSAVALPNLDLTIEKGKFVTLLGPSGCGKTTTLRIIAGLEEPSGGEVVLAGKEVYSKQKGSFVPPEKRGLGLIFQSYALWPNMKVDRNITLALTEAKLPKNEIEVRLAEAVDKVQLNGLETRYPSELSGGQQQRVAVARLIAARNSILLMDEPLSNLDAVLRTDMRAELKRLHHDLDATTIYVTHDQVEALTMSDIIVIMKGGDIQQQGSPYEVYHNPSNLFVAQFIGDPSINLLDGEFKKGGTGATLCYRDTQISCSADLSAKEGKVKFTIRPESVNLHYTEQPNAIKAEIDVIQPTGSQTIIYTKVDGQTIKVLVPGFVQREEKGSVWLSFDAEKLNVFDPQTELNLRKKAVSEIKTHAA